MKIHQEEKYDCKTCKKLFKSKTGLSQHELSHNGLRPFKCKMCGKSFQLRITLKSQAPQL